MTATLQFMIPAPQSEYFNTWSGYRRERVAGRGLDHRTWRINCAGDPAFI